jgi:mxaD protein
MVYTDLYVSCNMNYRKINFIKLYSFILISYAIFNLRNYYLSINTFEYIKELDMNTLLKSLFAVSLAIHLGGAYAANHQPMYVIKTVNINANADKVWDKVSKFSDLGAWHPAVAKTEIVAGTDGKSGAKRLLTLQDGGQIKETLQAYDNKQKSMRYIITEGVLPVKQYVSTLRVMPNGDSASVIVWESSFDAKNVGEENKAFDTINAVYESGLNNLKKISE